MISVAMMGGEEFIFILQGTDIIGATNFAVRIRKNVTKLPWHDDQSTFKLTMNIGITEREREGRDNEDVEHLLHTLMEESDATLYHSKVNGKDRVSIFSDLNKDT